MTSLCVRWDEDIPAANRWSHDHNKSNLCGWRTSDTSCLSSQHVIVWCLQRSANCVWSTLPLRQLQNITCIL